ncbi:MAG: GWxTD domain-containing protein, partial [bacterium]|nr:GWxTD domain-containing protein [bacterium]
MQIKKNNHWIAVSVAVLMVLGAGWVFGKKIKISGENAEFLSKVRYVISKDERKFFRNLPDEKRGEFIRQFWEVRDPDPNTTVNEFKQEYFSRIDEANRLFRGGRDGWLTDRGMTFVLLGPPLHVSEYPLGSAGGSGRPYLIWHYAEMAVLFVDIHGDGDYRVDYAGLGHHADVQQAFVKAKSEYKYMEDLFQYDFKLKKKDNARSLVFSILTEELDFK